MKMEWIEILTGLAVFFMVCFLIKSTPIRYSGLSAPAPIQTQISRPTTAQPKVYSSGHGYFVRLRARRYGE